MAADDTTKTIVWDFQKIGDKDLKAAIASIGEEGVKAAAAEQRAIKKSEIAWRQAQDKRLGVARYTSAQLKKELEGEATIGERVARRMSEAFERARKDSIRSIQGIGSDVAKLGATMNKAMGASGISFRGAFSSLHGGFTEMMGSAIRDTMKLQGMARRIAIDARRPGEAMADPTALRKSFEATAVANAGSTAEDVAGGVAAFRVKGGSLPDALKFADVITKMSQATGKSADEIGATAGKLFREFKITDANAMGDALAQISARSKSGGVSLEQASAQFIRLAGQAKQAGFDLEKTGVKGLNTLLTAASEGGDPEMAGRAAGQLMNKLTSQAVKLKQAPGGKGGGGLGLDIYRTDAGHETGELRAMPDIIADLISKARSKYAVKNDPGNAANMVAELKKQFGGGAKGSAYSAMSPMVDAFNKAYAAKQGTEQEKTAAGAQAVQDRFRELETSGGSLADSMVDVEAVQRSKGAQMTQAWEKIKQSVGDKVVPELLKLAESLSSNQGVMDMFLLAITGLANVISGIVQLAQAMHLIDGGMHTTARDQFARERLEAQQEIQALGPETATDSAETKAKRKAAKARELQAFRGFVTEEGNAIGNNEVDASRRGSAEAKYSADMAALMRKEFERDHPGEKWGGGGVSTQPVTAPSAAGAAGKPGGGGTGGAEHHAAAAQATKSAASAMHASATALQRAAEELRNAQPKSALNGAPRR